MGNADAENQMEIPADLRSSIELAVIENIFERDEPYIPTLESIDKYVLDDEGRIGVKITFSLVLALGVDEEQLRRIYV